VLNPEHRSHGVASAEVDGVRVNPGAVPLVDDGREHAVTIVLGTPSTAAATPIAMSAFTRPAT